MVATPAITIPATMLSLFVTPAMMLALFMSLAAATTAKAIIVITISSHRCRSVISRQSAVVNHRRIVKHHGWCAHIKTKAK